MTVINMSDAVRVCGVTDAACSRKCGLDHCKRDQPKLRAPEFIPVSTAGSAIKCSAKKCGWTGLRTALVIIPNQTTTFIRKMGCPKCSGTKFRFVTEQDGAAR